MKKRLTLLAILLMLVLTGCKTTTVNYENEEKDFWDKFVVVEGYDNMGDGCLYCLYIVYDKDTKVEYYIAHAYNGFGISTVYNADGTIKVYEEGE